MAKIFKGGEKMKKELEEKGSYFDNVEIEIELTPENELTLKIKSTNTEKEFYFPYVDGFVFNGTSMDINELFLSLGIHNGEYTCFDKEGGEI